MSLIGILHFQSHTVDHELFFGSLSLLEIGLRFGFLTVLDRGETGRECVLGLTLDGLQQWIVRWLGYLCRRDTSSSSEWGVRASRLRDRCTRVC